MKGVIHQLYFFPWLGYFSKLVECDCFVVLDDVLFRKRHYMDRTKIIDMHGNIRWIGLPIGENFKVPCNCIVTSKDMNCTKIKENIRHSYRRARHFEDVWSEIETLIDLSICCDKKLVDINLDIIKGVMSILNLNMPDIVFSSTFELSNEPTKRIVELCSKLSINELIVGNGKSLEVHDLSLLINEYKIDVFVQDFMKYHPEYIQLRRRQLGFEKGISILDIIFNEGIDKTRKSLISPEIKLEKVKIDSYIDEEVI